ncbi:hypothetical protein [Streptomyces sp. NPDC048248]|uniref:hypothetical protein n=1 Tax=Streptomyces sp. NPDC048248 TaxID=3365523 RepID=UPI0037208306
MAAFLPKPRSGGEAATAGASQRPTPFPVRRLAGIGGLTLFGTMVFYTVRSKWHT